MEYAKNLLVAPSVWGMDYGWSGFDLILIEYKIAFVREDGIEA